MLKHFEGNINQLTLFGQLSFIKDYVYKVEETKVIGVVLISGDFMVVETDERIQARIEFNKKELKKHYGS
jgi:hypothetical protein